MGTPIPIPFIPPPAGQGNDFPLCWGSGKPFGDGDTPDHVFASVSGVNKGSVWFEGAPEPPNGEFVLSQVAGQPGVFRFVGVGIIVAVGWRVLESSFVITQFLPQFSFVGDTFEACPIVFVNHIDDVFVGGTAAITVPRVV